MRLGIFGIGAKRLDVGKGIDLKNDIVSMHKSRE